MDDSCKAEQADIQLAESHEHDYADRSQQYQQEEAQEIQFNMQMQKLQAEGKMADKA